MSFWDTVVGQALGGALEVSNPIGWGYSAATGKGPLGGVLSDIGGGIAHMFDGTPPPDAPGFADLAKQQAAEAKKAIEQQTWDNRPEIQTPFGNVSWDKDPAGRWTMTQSLPDDQQKALWGQQALANKRTDAASGMMDTALADMQNNVNWDALPKAATPFSFGNLPGLGSADQARNSAENAIYQRSSSRLDPAWNQRENQMKTQLLNQGFDPNSEAYKNQMGEFNRNRTDAYQQAMDSAIMGGGQEAQRNFGMDLSRRQQFGSEGQQQYGMETDARNRAIQEAFARKYEGLNGMNAFLSGQQVGAPQMPGFMGAGAAQAPNLLGAGIAQDQGAMQRYGIQQAQRQGMQNGIYGLGGAAISALPLVI